MLKLDNNLLEELGLGGLPEDQKRQMLQHIYETLELRVGTQLANQMTDKQLEEFEKFIDAGGDTNQAQALQWLETNLPNYKQVVQQTFESLKAEVRSMAPQLLAAAQQTQGPQEAQVVAQPAPQGMPAPAQSFSQQDMTSHQPSMDPQQQSYGQSFQTPQPSAPSYGATQQSSYGTAPTPMPAAPQEPAFSQPTAAPMQPQNDVAPSVSTWQAPTPVVAQPVPMPEPSFGQSFQPQAPLTPTMSSPVAPVTPQSADPFASQPLQPTSTPSFDQPITPPQTPTPTWGQQPAPATTTPQEPNTPSSWQPQPPTSIPAPTWQPQPPTDQPQPPQVA